MSDFGEVTRVDVVDRNGVHEFWGDRWEINLHDEGRTLKLIQRDGYGAAAKAIRDVALAKDIAAGYQKLAEDPEYQRLTAARRHQLQDRGGWPVCRCGYTDRSGTDVGQAYADVRDHVQQAIDAAPSVGCLRCGGGVVGVEGRYQCRCGWAAPTTQSGLDEFHPESTTNPEEPKQ